MTDYQETLQEQAEYFDLPADDVEKMFLRFLHMNFEEAKAMDPFERAVCIGIYRITKLKGACRMMQKSRERWIGRAKEAGWVHSD